LRDLSDHKRWALNMLRGLTLLLAIVSIAFAQAPLDPPSKLELRIEGFLGDSYRAEIVPGSSVVVYRHNPDTFTDSGGTKEEKIEVPKDRWPVFWKHIEEAKVWSWKKRYSVSPNPPDGTVWSVALDWNGRAVRSAGANAYPEAKQFAAFKAAVSELLGGRKFE
jgi:hypothetical protein